MGSISWDDDEIRVLKRSWIDGFSASDIAMTLNSGKSRNAVLGKAHRLIAAGELPRRAPPKPARPAKAKGPAARKRAGATVALVRTPRPIPPAPSMTHLICTEALTATTCRWPIGDPKLPGFGFCGAEAGETYCPYHRALAYLPRKLVEAA